MPAYCRDVTDTEEVTGDEKWRNCTEQSGSKVGQVNGYLRQSYDANFMIMVVNAAEVSNNCQAAKKYGVTECNV